MSNSPLALSSLWSPGSTVVLGQVITWSLLDWLLLALPLPEDYQLPAIFALAGAQYATLAGWLALGDGSVLMRAGFAVHAILWTELINPAYAPFGMAILFASLAIVLLTAPIAILRLRGWSCQLSNAHRSDRVRRLQFGIWHLLVLMTLVAAALGLMRLMTQPRPGFLVPFVLLVLILGILPWTQWFALLQPKLAAALPSAVSSALLFWACGALAFGLIFGLPVKVAMALWTCLVVIHTIVLSLHLMLLRACGYRLLR